MAKATASIAKNKGKIPNKAIYSRISYLYQVATYLATQTQQPHSEASKVTNQEPPLAATSKSADAMSRRMAAELRSVSLKVQLRISPEVKQTMCKNCDTILYDGTTCTTEVENKSKGAKKRWADILARKCNTCGVVKRYPLTAPRQKRRPLRHAETEVSLTTTAGV